MPSTEPLLDTQKSVLHVNGRVSLKSQALNAEVDADAKSFDLLDLHGAVMIQGKLRAPQVSLPCAGLTQQLLSGT